MLGRKPLPEGPGREVDAGDTRVREHRVGVADGQAALIEAHGIVTIETDRTYLPGAAEGTADTRRLGLRIFEIRAVLQ